jgi:hypothetical protein
MACADDADRVAAPCEYWDEDGCYCVCGTACSCAYYDADKVVVMNNLVAGLTPFLTPFVD